jgi:hypothetical protein
MAPTQLRTPRLALALLLALAFALPSAPARAAEDLVLTGTKVLAEAAVRGAAGTIPRLGNRDPWAQRAVARILALYRAKGYSQARAWYRLEPDGTLRIDVDEGRLVGVVFLGADPQQTLAFRMGLTLPEDVFHGPTVTDEVEHLRRAFRDSVAYLAWEVVEREERVPNRLGQEVPVRELRIHVVRKVRYGWMVEATLDSTYGLVPGVRYRHTDLALDDDRFLASLDLGVPYRRLLFEPDPQFTWVYGRLGGEYWFPPFAGGALAPALDAQGTLSRYARTDLGLAAVRAASWHTIAELGITAWRPRFTVLVGLGAADTRILDTDKLATDGGEPPVTPSERGAVRLVLRGALDVDLDPEVLRTGRKRAVRLETTLGFVSGELVTDTRLTFQYLWPRGFHDLILRGRALLVAGDVRFWDEQPLAGSCQRVFFGDRYWVRQAAQVELAARASLISDKLKLGVFHDASLFGNESQPGSPVKAANAFGPSLHLLFLDQFALDLYYAFGFAPVGFGHNFSLVLQSTL